MDCVEVNPGSRAAVVICARVYSSGPRSSAPSLMTTLPELPYRATTAQACTWLALQTATPWTLARLIEHGLTPYVWLDYDASHAELFGDANGGYPAPIFFEGDTRRLAEGSADVLMTMTKDAYHIVARLPAPGFSRPLEDLRFLKKDLQRLLASLERQASPAPSTSAAQPRAAQESQDGIGRDQVIAAFAGLVKIDLAAALTQAGGIFGDDGARVKASTRKGKHKTVWNPVTLALGLNEVYRVPLPRLKRAFATDDSLAAWAEQWDRTLALLGQ